MHACVRACVRARARLHVVICMQGASFVIAAAAAAAAVLLAVYINVMHVMEVDISSTLNS